MNESLGEIKFPQYNRSAIGQSKLGNSQYKERRNEELGQTIDYEGEELKVPDAADHKPIYESGEGPVIKGNKKLGDKKPRYDGKAGSGNGVMVGESFGINPLKSGKGALIAESKAYEKRDRI